MDALFGLIVLFLIGVWAVWVIKGNQQRPRKNERFIGYINRYDEDGEPYQAEIWLDIWSYKILRNKNKK